MQHPGAVDLNRPDANAQAMRNRLVRFALDQAIEDLSFAPGKLRDLVSCVADAPLGRPGETNFPAFDCREQAARKFALEEFKPLVGSLPRLPFGLQCRRGVDQFARSHVHHELETMLDHLPVGDVANDAKQ